MTGTQLEGLLMLTPVTGVVVFGIWLNWRELKDCCLLIGAVVLAFVVVFMAFYGLDLLLGIPVGNPSP